LDSTVIDLCVKVFDWARFRRTKGAIKLHLQLDHQGYLPCWALVTEGKTHDVKAAQGLSFAPGTIVAMDRGYNDYRLFAVWTEAGVFFVTRAKENMVYEVVEDRDVPERGNILSDETIRLTGIGAGKKCSHLLRRVAVWDAENAREIVLLTNLFHLAASTVAAVYKERWQIELFFKALKQNLKVKTFVGTSENAVKTQVWVALIAILLLKYLQLRSSWGWSLSNLAAMLRFNLLTYRDLWAWLDAPYQVPILDSQENQLEFFAT
jgi:IS4 transposase